MSEARPPLVLIGERGCGKSSLLANWVKQRRIRRQTTGSSPELVFLHLSGASRESNKVSTLLLRAVSELKAFFGLQVGPPFAPDVTPLSFSLSTALVIPVCPSLQMAVSSKEQKLSWEFMRAIESAARKGRVILVIDGVAQLESTMFARLKWLPLHFPANVRVILSATVTGAELALATGGNVPRTSSPARNLSGRSPARVPSTAILADTSDDEKESTGPALDVVAASGATLKRNAGSMNKEIAELTRRGWQMIQVGCLVPVFCGVNTKFTPTISQMPFLSLSERRVVVQTLTASAIVPDAVSSMATPAYVSCFLLSSRCFDCRCVHHRAPAERRRSSIQLPDDALFLTAPLHLTELQIEEILRAPCAASPVFLRRLIDSLKLAQFDGMPVSVMLDRCMSAGSIRDLIQRLLSMFTRGWSPAFSEYQPPSSPVAGASSDDDSRPTVITRPLGEPVPGG